MMGIFPWSNDTYKRYFLYLVFAIADKKKYLRGYFTESRGNITLKSTGKCGLEGIMYAKNKILELEEILKDEGYENCTIVIAGEDKRRERIYEKAAKKYGYKRVFKFG